MTNHDTDAELRKHLVDLLEGGSAHIKLADVVRDFPLARAGIRPEGSPHSAWELLEHMRIAQADIVLFSSGKDYVELKWPDDYWPSSPSPNDGQWERSADAVRRDLHRFVEMVKDEKRNLFEAFPWADGPTLLREALLIADHNSYHLGQLMLVRSMVSASE